VTFVMLHQCQIRLQKSARTLGLRNQTPALWKEDADCGNGYHRERGSDFVFCGRREKKKKKKKSLLWFERERNREMKMRIIEF
jgi:hypothetical protein